MPNIVKLSHNGTSDAQASVYLWVGVAIGVYIRVQVNTPHDLFQLKIEMLHGAPSVAQFLGWVNLHYQIF